MVVRVRDPSRGGFVPYVPPSTPSVPSKPSLGGGGSGGSTPVSPSQPSTVYIYKGKEYYSEADVKSAIAQNIISSESVQTILKKQGGGSETVYVYQGSTYASPQEVQAQISKETAGSPQVQSIVKIQEASQPSPPKVYSFTTSPLTASSKLLTTPDEEAKFMSAPASLSLSLIDRPSEVSAKPKSSVVPSVSGRPVTLGGRIEHSISKGHEATLASQKKYDTAAALSKEKAIAAGETVFYGFGTGILGTSYGIVRHPVSTVTSMFKPSTYKQLWKSFEEAPLGTLSEVGGSVAVFKGVGDVLTPQIPKGVGFVRTVGRGKVPLENIGVGAESIPLSTKITASSLKRSFKEGTLYPRPMNIAEYPKSSFLPSEKGGSYMWHAAPGRFAKEAVVGKGTSEVPGLYGAPVLESYFLKVKPSGYSFIGQELPSIKFPSAIRVKVKGFERLTPKREVGVAQMPLSKMEYEAVIPPETKLVRSGKSYYTKVEGVRIPIQEYRVVGKGEVGVEFGKISKRSSGYSGRVQQRVPYYSSVSSSYGYPSFGVSYGFGFSDSYVGGLSSSKGLGSSVRLPSYPKGSSGVSSKGFKSPSYGGGFSYSDSYASGLSVPSLSSFGYAGFGKMGFASFTAPKMRMPDAKGVFPREKPIVKSRPYRYTPNLLGIEFGRPLKKAPSGRKLWSGYELRPLVGFRFRSMF